MKRISLALVGIYVIFLFGYSAIIPVQAHFENDEYEQAVEDNTYLDDNCGSESSLCEETTTIDTTEQVSWENCQNDENLCEPENVDWNQDYIPEDYDCNEGEGVGGHFSDICSYEDDFYPLEYLYEKGVFSGNDGKFQKYKSLSRVELLKIAYKAKGVTPVFDKRFSFKDVGASAWYAPYVSQALKDKVVKGKDDRLFHPNDAVTKAEQIKIIFSVLGISPVIDDSEVDWDIDQKHWVVPYLKAARAKNVLKQSYSGESFYADTESQRMESIPLLFKALVMKESGGEKFSWGQFQAGNFTHFEEKLLSSSGKIEFDYPKYMDVTSLDPEEVLAVFELFDDESSMMQSEIRGMESEEKKVMKLFIEDFSTFIDMGKKLIKKYMADESILLNYPGYDIEDSLDSMNITINSTDKENFKKNMELSYQDTISLLDFFINSKGVNGFLDFIIQTEDMENKDAQEIRGAFQALRDLLNVLRQPLDVTFGEPVSFGGNVYIPVHTNMKKIFEEELAQQLKNMQVTELFGPFLDTSAFDDSYLLELNGGKKVVVVGGVNIGNSDHVKILSSLLIK